VDVKGVWLTPEKAPQLMLPAVQDTDELSELAFINELDGKYSTGELVGQGVADAVILPV
jgi:hypothetical protein